MSNTMCRVHLERDAPCSGWLTYGVALFSASTFLELTRLIQFMDRRPRSKEHLRCTRTGFLFEKLCGMVCRPALFTLNLANLANLAHENQAVQTCVPKPLSGVQRVRLELSVLVRDGEMVWTFDNLYHSCAPHRAHSSQPPP